jgi:hypothetical protein
MGLVGKKSGLQEAMSFGNHKGWIKSNPPKRKQSKRMSNTVIVWYSPWTNWTKSQRHCYSTNKHHKTKKHWWTREDSFKRIVWLVTKVTSGDSQLQ